MRAHPGPSRALSGEFMLACTSSYKPQRTCYIAGIPEMMGHNRPTSRPSPAGWHERKPRCEMGMSR